MSKSLFISMLIMAGKNIIFLRRKRTFFFFDYFSLGGPASPPLLDAISDYDRRCPPVHIKPHDIPETLEFLNRYANNNINIFIGFIKFITAKLHRCLVIIPIFITRTNVELPNVPYYFVLNINIVHELDLLRGESVGKGMKKNQITSTMRSNQCWSTSSKVAKCSLSMSRTISAAALCGSWYRPWQSRR